MIFIPIPNETLGQKQERFTLMLATFLVLINLRGYKTRLKEVERTAAGAAANAAKGTGIVNSLHRISLAADVVLTKNGVLLTNSADYREAGELWESLGGSWGGRFSKPDGNHFSLAHNGVR
jgi:hypothetical protein